MTYINENYLKLTGGYLFSEIRRLVQSFRDENPSAKLIRLDIGDVTEPLAPAVIRAMHAAIDEMAVRSSFRGYGPEQGYDFLPRKTCICAGVSVESPCKGWTSKIQDTGKSGGSL